MMGSNLSEYPNVSKGQHAFDDTVNGRRIACLVGLQGRGDKKEKGEKKISEIPAQTPCF